MYDHITPALYNLHLLPEFYRIYLKIIITFKAIYDMSPNYISNLELFNQSLAIV